METGIVKLSPELLAMFAGQAGTNALAPFTREVFLLDINVAGTGYCEQMKDIYPKLQIGTVLQLRRDPQNKYDKQAIGVYYEQIRIGWVPRTMNTIISRLMDAGKAFFCRITTLNEKDPDNPWKDIECKIFMVE